MPNLSDLKTRASAHIDQLKDEFIATSLHIHANPELLFKEYKSSATLCQLLERHGFAVERGVGGLETAFWAEAGGNGDGPTIAILAEYDALPEIGHACGHNIIGTSAVAAGIAVKSVLSELPGRVVVIGTPGEEGGGGKVIMAKAGVFNEVDAAMMTHPASRNMTMRGSLASNRLKIEFFGKAAHASSSPDEGINALDATVQTYVNISTLRHHIRGDARIHGIITHGGAAPNIIPEYSAMSYSIRAATKQYADELLERVIKCAEGAAAATGCTVKCTVTPGYTNMIPNQVMAAEYEANCAMLGRVIEPPKAVERMGSTDMGDISQILPSIHPYLKMVPPTVAGHTIEFREAAKSPEGHAVLLDAAKAMAMTTIALLGDADLMARVKGGMSA